LSEAIELAGAPHYTVDEHAMEHVLGRAAQQLPWAKGVAL
jgi:hypothetical protein